LAAMEYAEILAKTENHYEYENSELKKQVLLLLQAQVADEDRVAAATSAADVLASQLRQARAAHDAADADRMASAAKVAKLEALVGVLERRLGDGDSRDRDRGGDVDDGSTTVATDVGAPASVAAELRLSNERLMALAAEFAAYKKLVAQKMQADQPSLKQPSPRAATAEDDGGDWTSNITTSPRLVAPGRATFVIPADPTEDGKDGGCSHA